MAYVKPSRGWKTSYVCVVLPDGLVNGAAT